MDLVRCIFLLLLTSGTIAQDSAFIHINPETEYPYNEHTEAVESNALWIINGKEISYLSGIYSFPLNSGSKFDTIKRLVIYSKKIYKRGFLGIKKVTRLKDTAVYFTITKFRKGGNYSLSQITPGSFNFFSLDTFNIEQKVKSKFVNFKREDTLFFKMNFNTYEVFSDTSINVFDPNKQMKYNLLTRFTFNDKRPDYRCNIFTEPLPIYEMFEFTYCFLHGETLVIEFDVSQENLILKLQ